MPRVVSILLGIAGAKSLLAMLCCCGAGPIGFFGILVEDAPDGPPALFALVVYWGLAAWQAVVGGLCATAAWKLYKGEPTALPVIAAVVGAASGLFTCDVVAIGLCGVALALWIREGAPVTA